MSAHKACESGPSRVRRSSSRVQFDLQLVSSHNSEIEIAAKNGGSYEVNLGLMKIRHIYEVKFFLKHTLGKDVKFDPKENQWVKVKSLAPAGDGHKVVVEFNAGRENIMHETITLRKSNNDEAHAVIFHARVLGKHEGTPSLRSGIRCIRVEPDTEQKEE